MTFARSVSLGATVVVLALGHTPVHAQPAWSGLPALPAEVQIRLAVQAAPDGMADDATVQGYGEDGTFGVLRHGSNQLICMAPDPAREEFEVSCHHAGLEDFFRRGRELRESGITGQERLQARWDEYAAGELDIPAGAVNHILQGSGFDPETGAVADPYLRSVIYTPDATSASTGIGAQPSTGGPWLMFPGTPGAHIMLTPPRDGSGG